MKSSSIALRAGADLVFTAFALLLPSAAEARIDPPQCVIVVSVPDTHITRVVDFNKDVVIYKAPASEGGIAIKSFNELTKRAQDKLEEERRSLPDQCK